MRLTIFHIFISSSLKTNNMTDHAIHSSFHQLTHSTLLYINIIKKIIKHNHVSIY